MPTNVLIEPAPLASPSAQALIAELNAELAARYPEDDADHDQIDAGEVAPGRGVFPIAYCDGEIVGCGAVRRIEDGGAEIKRMYVRPAARRRGIAVALLARLEDEARALATRRLILETGERQPEALALYRRAGFREIPLYGGYIDSPGSVCFAKDLA